ncbi:hypothetical protein [Amycolatopsis vancoresmycina]|uniref:NHL repeat-containing protein n=1 Tax=Amycolatopsis vancoresmycina DSM 44592 TaxID=1292037 RepID=R1HHU9_9PSEU|nr:hypothetical protein [Amycolatopsis vancoresmycina]EOD63170.1 NHL repeat-containing protein [Amycolatopsis vancoresmycina DSM 44592]
MTETQVTTGFDAPPLRRLRYFHGELLSARDFQQEQDYFREKLKLRLRCLLGYGVVCGLHVEPAHDDEHAAAEAGSEVAHRHRAKVRITPGLAVDCEGNEVVVRGSCTVDLWKALPPEERDKTTVWVGVRYAERPVEPSRAVFDDGCADTPDCEFTRIEECFAVRVTGCEPPVDDRCDTCCQPCAHRTLWLAEITEVDFGEPVRPERIRQDIRRPFGRHVPTVITGVNWIHGHTYGVDEAKKLLGTQDEAAGLVVRFSDDVRVDSLQPGVVQVQVIEGGAGRNADTWYMGGKFAAPDAAAGEFTREFRYRQTTRETLQDGDQVVITVRAAFLLDRCCRPVDGTNVGGRVPLIGAEDTTPGGGCARPPSGIGPWTSGTGAGGDVFESWFFVKEG